MTPEEVKYTAERSLYFFLKGILGWDKLVEPLHTEACAFLQAPQPRAKMMLMPRNCFKTTIATGLVLHMLIQPKEHNIYFPGMAGCDTRVLYAAETATTAEKRTSWILRRLETHRLLRAFWPNVCWADLNTIPVQWTNTAFIVPRFADSLEATVTGIGVGGASTGNHYDALIKDDLIALAAAQSSEVMAAAIEWNKEAQSLVNDPMTSREYYFGTRWANYDIYQAVQEEYGMKDVSTGLYQRAIVENGASIFPERFPLEFVEMLKRKQGDLFFLNYMNTAAGTGQTAFDLRTLRTYERDGDLLSFDEEFDADMLAAVNLEKTEKAYNDFTQPEDGVMGADRDVRPRERETGASVGEWYRKERARRVREGQVKPRIRSGDLG